MPIYLYIRCHQTELKHDIHMKEMKFKTNVKCQGCITAMGLKINKVIKPEDWSVDLKTPEKILIVTADVPAEKILEAITAAGFVGEQL